jgi:hypothetical protein
MELGKMGEIQATSSLGSEFRPVEAVHESRPLGGKGGTKIRELAAMFTVMEILKCCQLI